MRSQTVRTGGLASPNRRNIAQLEKQLMGLKEKEKKYIHMSRKVRQLQQKSKMMRKQGQVSGQVAESDEIEHTKMQIQRTNANIKRLDEDNKVVRSQVKNLENQLRVINEAHASICNENKTQRQRIQLKDQQLVDKENELEGLIEKKHCNELVVEELRIDLDRLEGEEEELRRQLEQMRMERIEEEKERQKLRETVEQLRNEIREQEQNSSDWRYRLTQVKEGNNVIKEELITLINLEEKLHEQLQRGLANYQTITATEMQSRHKLKLLLEELKVAEEDVRMLTDEYIKENSNLREEEKMNEQYNGELDIMAKQVFAVWEGVKELIEINPTEGGEIKIKCYQVWGQICKILNLQ